ncbi:uncharacterized protein LOC115717030 [Cannabis sativa]|uniref:uncharacterized protein LOC115717030 n=1 Tax=Cannabis sativa TaxID=3483 RepID=UPI0029CAA825|nr:uncharacterized protein LOC115717030 [Cannabis sativa]XP_030502570.2 uncharacterized protein LOC115717030 [Cannabis sativa]
MLKRLPSRNQRTKGFRAKHALQICLLLGVCFWLIYQVKHSHDKKKEFDENDAKTTIRVSDGEIPKLGRKDLHPREDITKVEKHEEEEEEEIAVEEEEQHGEEREEEENKNESQEQEEEEEENKNEDAEDNKNEEAEDGGRGGGDDEIDESDQERKEEEGNHDEEFVDEEKEREEEGGDDTKKNDNEEIEDQVDKEHSSEDQDSDGGDQTDHEAREEHYIRDDASSEVAHDTQVINTGTEKISSESTIENTEAKNLEQDDKSNNPEDVKKIESNAGSKVAEGETGGNHTSLDTVSLAQKVDYDNLPNSSDNQVSITMQSNNRPEAGNYSEMGTEKSGSFEQIKIETNDSSQQNITESVTDSVPAQITKDVATTRGSEIEEIPSLAQTDNSTIGSLENKIEFNSTNSTKTDKTDGASEELSDSSKNPVSNALEQVVRPEQTLQVEDGTTSTTKQNADATENGKSDNKIDSDAEEDSSDSTGGTEDAVQHDPIDSSDTQIAQEMNEVRMDLSTLPDMDSQRVDSEEIAAE